MLGPTYGVEWGSWQAGAELLARVVQQVLDRHPEAEHTMLWEALRYWVLGGAESGAIVEEVLEEAKSPKGAGMPYAGVEELKERAYREGLRQAHSVSRPINSMSKRQV